MPAAVAAETSSVFTWRIDWCFPLWLAGQVEAIGTGGLSMDALVRSFVRARLSYRFVETESGEAAYRIERLVQAGELAGVGKPLLNPR